MPLKSHTKHPPGGFPYKQYDKAGKVVRTFDGNVVASVEAQAEEVRVFRMANPHLEASTDREDCINDVDDYQCARLHNDKKWCMAPEQAARYAQKKTLMQRWSLPGPSQSAAVAGFVRGSVSGGKILLDWLGSGGKPVPSEQAQARANGCLYGNSGKPCPHNASGSWWENNRARIAAKVRSYVEAKNDLKLTVEGEAGLRLCQACGGCYLPLKIHVPLAHILTETTKAEIDSTPEWCFLKTELYVDSPPLLQS